MHFLSHVHHKLYHTHRGVGGGISLSLSLSLSISILHCFAFAFNVVFWLGFAFTFTCITQGVCIPPRGLPQQYPITNVKTPPEHMHCTLALPMPPRESYTKLLGLYHWHPASHAITPRNICITNGVSILPKGFASLHGAYLNNTL